MSKLSSLLNVLILIFPLSFSFDQRAAAQRTAFVTTERIQSGRVPGDPLAIRSLHPTYDLFPDASLVDFSYLLDPPAGTHGFVRVSKNGRLEFEDGKAARFWGVVIDQQNVDIPKWMIDLVVETLARAGVNIIRLHSLDNRTGEKYGVVRHNIIDEASPHDSTSQFIDEDFRDRVDYWIGAAKKKGIYTYLGFRAYRTFRIGDQVPNADSLDRAARPYAIFNRRLIELQKQFIDSFAVFHVNPYTRLSYAHEPAVACFELVNEDDMLFRPEVWSKMPEPYCTEIRRRWNDWLGSRYKKTEALRRAWSNDAGLSALTADETLENQDVRLPNMELQAFDQAVATSYDDSLKSPVRRGAAARFAIDLQRGYFKELREHCLSRGIRVPLTAVVRTDLRPMTFTVAEELDMLACNAYFDHPSFISGKEWIGQEFFTNKNSMAEVGTWSFAPFIAQVQWAGHPSAIREWSTCWPNAYRGTSVLEAAAYSRLQGFDLVTHFNYTTTGNFTTIGIFGLQADPVRWGLFGLAAKMFLTADVEEAKRTVAIRYAEEDLTAYATYETRFSQLAWMHRVVNTMVSDTTRYDLTITSGRSHRSTFNGQNGIIYARTPFVDAQAQQRLDQTNNIFARSGYECRISFLDRVPSVSNLGVSPAISKIRWGFEREDVRKRGFLALGQDQRNALTAGFRDTLRNILAVAGISESDVLPMAVQMMFETYRTPTEPRMFNQRILQSDTRQLTKHTADGYMIINSKSFCAVQGALTVGRPYEAGVLRVVSASPTAVVVATSLDDKPLGESSFFVIKMVTVAENYGQALDTVDVSSLGRRIALRSRGGFPVITKGAPIGQPTSVWINGWRAVDVYLVNGTWEILFDRRSDRSIIYCDTPNIRFHLDSEGKRMEARLITYLYGREPLASQKVQNDFVYPGYSKYVVVENSD